MNLAGTSWGPRVSCALLLGLAACSQEPPVRSAPTVSLPVAVPGASTAMATTPPAPTATEPPALRGAPGAEALPLDGSPVKGAPDARVTVVEFADLECPPCREAQQAVDRVLAAHPGQVRVVFKSYPLKRHPHAEAAARAAFAAGRQGRFWEMERALLEGQEHLEPGDVEGYARKLGLDLARFRADLAAPEVADRVARDRQLGDAVKLQGTPTFFVDGRMVADDDVLDDRVRDALDGR